MLADRAAEFEAGVRFAGLDYAADDIARAVDHSRFEQLRDKEARDGFGEPMPWASSFFREGRAGSWCNVLSPEQIRAVADVHAPAIERFCNLREAEAFLGG